jgi:hypothetical protein
LKRYIVYADLFDFGQSNIKYFRVLPKEWAWRGSYDRKNLLKFDHESRTHIVDGIT